MLTLPTHDGWIVEYKTAEVSKRTGRAIWHEALCTTSKSKADEKAKELRNKGLTVRVLQGVF